LRAAFPCLVFIGILIAGCGGGGLSSGSLAPPTKAPTSGASPPLCPAPPANTFPLAVANNTGIGSKLLVYLWGHPAGSSNWVYLTDPIIGATATIPPAGSPIPSVTMPPSGCVNLPQLSSARLYFYFQTDSTGASAIQSNGPTGGVNPPNAQNSAFAGDIHNVWDYLEYTWTPGTSMTLDVTAVDGVGIPSQFWLSNVATALTSAYGLPPTGLSTSIGQLQALGTPWTGLIQQTQTTGMGATWSRIVAPGKAIGANTVSFDSSYYSGTIAALWGPTSPYTGSNYLHLAYPQFPDAYGVVQSNAFNFYSSTSPSPGATPMASIPYPQTIDVFGNAGAFAANATGPYSLVIGRALSVNIDRGTLPLPSPLPANWPTGIQPFCGLSDWKVFYRGYLNGASVSSSTVMNWYSAIVHKNAAAPTAGLPGLLYGFPDDDECSNPSNPAVGLYAAVATEPYIPGYQWNVTLNRF